MCILYKASKIEIKNFLVSFHIFTCTVTPGLNTLPSEWPP